MAKGAVDKYELRAALEHALDDRAAGGAAFTPAGIHCRHAAPRLQPRRPRLERVSARKGGHLEDVRLDGAVGRRRAVKAVAQHKLAQLGERHGGCKVVVKRRAVDARARAKAAPRLLFALDLVLGARLDVVDGLVRPAAKVAEDFKLPSAAPAT